MKDIDINELRQDFADAPDEALFETRAVAAFMSMSISYLDNKAVRGGGIPYTKLSNKRLYKKKDVLDWLEVNGQKVCSTTEYKTV